MPQSDTCQLESALEKKKKKGQVHLKKIQGYWFGISKPFNDLAESIIHFYRWIVYEEYLCKLQGEQL